MPEEICELRTSHNLNTLWADCVVGDFTRVYCEEKCCTGCIDRANGFQIQEDEAPHSATASPPANNGTTQVENQQLHTFLIGHMDGFQQRLNDTQSHAYNAYLWLGNDDAYYNSQLDDFRKLQRFGLVAFYLSTSSELGWKVSNGWTSTEHECGWYGIFCALNDTVTSISLPSNRLTGTIPPEIALAAIGGKIRVLNLAVNNISGEIPEQLGTLTHLELLGRYYSLRLIFGVVRLHFRTNPCISLLMLALNLLHDLSLDLRSNDFTGKIPSQIGKLKLLKSLMFQANELTGDMPAEVCSLRTTGALDELIADCDDGDPFSQVVCDIDCCTECYR